MSQVLTKPCQHCGKEFERDNRSTFAYWKRQKYCSQKCAGLVNSARLLAARPDMARKFNSLVTQQGDCWEWMGARDKDGYGIFAYARKSYRAPKIALELDGRPVLRGMYACHTCDNPACVKPLHLYPGTPKQNSADTIARGRVNYGRKAKITPDDVRAIRSSLDTRSDLAARFGISPSNISMIQSGKTWRHVR